MKFNRNEVMIAANLFVNFDVLDVFWILGNSWTIHLKNKASESYIDNRVLNILIKLLITLFS